MNIQGNCSRPPSRTVAFLYVRCQQREGIFFTENDAEKMLRIITSGWAQLGITEVRTYHRVVPKSVNFSAKTGPNYDLVEKVMEKTSQTEIRYRYLHQTDFASRSPRSQKIRISKGFCEDNLPLQMSEQNSHGRGGTDTASGSDTRPSRAGRQFLLAYQNQWWLLV